MPNGNRNMKRIVIVGGGAGGLVLATRLGWKLGRKRLAEIVLVDAVRTHIWKPLLHQLAAGSFDTHAEEIEYVAQARWNHFRFRLGRLAALDRASKTISLAATLDDGGNEIMPAQQLSYDILVIAVGSYTNDFGTPGAAEHTIKLDTPEAARRFNDRLLNAFMRAQTLPPVNGNGRLTVAIVGGGATGVELAAELHAAAHALVNFGFEHIHPEKDLRIVLVEAGPRLLPQLPERLSKAALRELHNLAIEVHTNERVVNVTEKRLTMASGNMIAANITVWAAGIKAPDFLRQLGGDTDGKGALETNKINQLVVNDRLQTTHDADVYAFGDCADCAQPGGSHVPPRAQAAYQQAKYLADAIARRVIDDADVSYIAAFRYRDKGSLVSLSEYSSVGSLMGSLTRGSLFIEGQIAKLMYWGLHKQHQLALGGLKRTLLITLSELIDRTYRPRIKLH